jgi:uncharacterized protein YjbI with pentapeptide repeats
LTGRKERIVSEEKYQLELQNIRSPSNVPSVTAEHRWGETITPERQAELDGYLQRWMNNEDAHDESAGPFAHVQLAGDDIFWLVTHPFATSKSKVINFIGAHLERAYLEGATLRKAQLTGAHLAEANLRGAHLEEAYLYGAYLEKAHLEEVHLKEAYLQGAHLEGAYLQGAHLEKAHLYDAHLEGADLSGAHLEGTELGQANLAGAHLEKAHLEGADLKGAYLARATLSEANLEGANLRDAYLYEAVLGRAYLKATSLLDAHLVKADLHEANLEGADIRRACLHEAVLDRVYLGQADLRGTHLEENAVTPVQLEGAALSDRYFDHSRRPADIGDQTISGYQSSSPKDATATLHLEPGSRIDEVLTSFHTLGNMMGVSHLASEDWGEPTPKSKAGWLSRLPTFRDTTRKRIGISSHEAPAVALVDWTSLNNTCRLLMGKEINDPFVAIIDLSAVICAVIFYDYVIALDAESIVEKSNALLGLNNIIRAINPSITISDEEDMDIDEGPDPENSTLQVLLDNHLERVITELSRATRTKDPWMSWLKQSWKQLLPSLRFPSHISTESLVTYSGSSSRPNALDTLFRNVGGTYLLNENAGDDLILDNDIRALFYEYLAQTLSSLLWDTSESPPVRYIGGCLRMPMLTARAKLAEAQLDPTVRAENWLQARWQQLYQQRQYPIRLPVWMDAALAPAKNRSDLVRSLNELRTAAKRFRRDRARLEMALAGGDTASMEMLSAELHGDAEQLTQDWTKIAGTSVNLASAVMKVAVPVVPSDIVRATGELALTTGMKAWLEATAVRLFRPQAWVVYKMGRQASKLQRSVERAFKIFELQRGVATEPVQFLERLGSVSWPG